MYGKLQVKNILIVIFSVTYLGRDRHVNKFTERN
jgi:hypothetical protein